MFDPSLPLDSRAVKRALINYSGARSRQFGFGDESENFKENVLLIWPVDGPRALIGFSELD